jgi:hypothetical protein
LTGITASLFKFAWRNYERKKLEDAQATGSGGVLFPFGASYIFSKKIKRRVKQ